MVLKPLFVYIGNRFINRDSRILKSVVHIYKVRNVNHSARARAALDIVKLRTAEKRNLLTVLHGKSLIIVLK